MIRSSKFLWIFWCLTASVVLFGMPPSAVAQSLTEPLPTGPTSTCTNNDAVFDPDDSGSPGIVDNIVKQVEEELNSISQNMFNTISGSGNFQSAVGAMVVLYISIYGIFFAFGMASESVYLFTLRVIKIVLLALLINGGAWALFNEYVVKFFDTAVKDLIDVVSTSVSGAAGVPTDKPIGVLDGAINKAFSAKMIVHLAAMATTGMYGAVHALFAAWALVSLAGSFLLAIWIYLMSLVMRTLLFGLAPIFLACLLFERTKPIFLGWVNQIISVCLQPIFLFTFLSFFLTLIGSAMDSMLVMPVCWTEVADTARATPFQTILPRFTIFDSSGNLAIYKGDWYWQGAETGDPNAPKILYPVDILALADILPAHTAGRAFQRSCYYGSQGSCLGRG
jgi:type IV secretory pathway VirB6-like protein